MDFTPHTEADVRRALEAIGLAEVEELFADIPASLRDPDLDLPEGMDEVTLLRHLKDLAARNRTAGPSFLGGGVRTHFIPTVTPYLALQGEFVTAYTPYQPEVSQGILQATFEYQTMLSELTALPVSNASMYDGATAVAEAALVAVRHTGRTRVLASRALHPETLQVLHTYLWPLGIELELVPLDGLRTAAPRVTEAVACVIIQNPNFLGYLEAMPAFASAAHAAGALLVAVPDPLSLAVLSPPGEYGADIAAGEGQTLGNPVSLGGPHFGFLVVDLPLLRQLPGRLVGQTRDVDGKRGFVLTLQAREQHIRRSKAKSNICSNHQLAALMATVNMAALGPAGLAEMARASAVQAHRLADALASAGGRVRREAAFFNEFVLHTEHPGEQVRAALLEQGVQAGVPLPASLGFGHAVLLSATELTTDEDIATLVAALGRIGEVQDGSRP